MSADIHGLVGAYAVDAIDEQERGAFELHLAECPECQAEVASLRAAAASSATCSEAAPPRRCAPRCSPDPHGPPAAPSRAARTVDPAASGPVGDGAPTADAPPARVPSAGATSVHASA